MKPLPLVLVCALLLLSLPAQADRPDSGFFVGGAASVTRMTGTGTWNGFNFDIGAPLSEGGDAVGLAWNENLLLGGKPFLGYQVNDSLSLQASLGLNFPKASNQTYTETNGNIIYQQGFNSEWTQRSAELTMSFHSTSDLAYFLYGGISYIKVTNRVTLFEGSEITDPLGQTIFVGDSNTYQDDFTTPGFHFGAGFEFPTGGDNRTIYVAGQYEVAQNRGTFHGTPDFNVDVGGFTLMLGIKWFPWAD